MFAHDKLFDGVRCLRWSTPRRRVCQSRSRSRDAVSCLRGVLRRPTETADTVSEGEKLLQSVYVVETVPLSFALALHMEISIKSPLQFSPPRG